MSEKKKEWFPELLGSFMDGIKNTTDTIMEGTLGATFDALNGKGDSAIEKVANLGAHLITSELKGDIKDGIIDNITNNESDLKSDTKKK